MQAPRPPGRGGPSPDDAGDEAVPPLAPAGFDPGWVGLRPLSDVEYANTAVDLLGVAIPDGVLFAPDPEAEAPTNGFDNLATAPAVSTWRLPTATSPGGARAAAQTVSDSRRSPRAS